MDVSIRTLEPADLDAVVELSLAAWAPVFDSMRGALGNRIFERVYPDWRALQAAAVAVVCRGPAVWVAVEPAADGGRVVGFVAVTFHDESASEPGCGEIDMVAVDPAAQRRGIGDALISFAVDHIRAAGAPLAIVATGGDPGHAPARAAYEKAGFVPLPLVRYYLPL